MIASKHEHFSPLSCVKNILLFWNFLSWIKFIICDFWENEKLCPAATLSPCGLIKAAPLLSFSTNKLRWSTQIGRLYLLRPRNRPSLWTSLYHYWHLIWCDNYIMNIVVINIVSASSAFILGSKGFLDPRLGIHFWSVCGILPHGSSMSELKRVLVWKKDFCRKNIIENLRYLFLSYAHICGFL